MTEKRFECYDLIFLDGFIRDHVENENIDGEKEIVELLNELHEENQALKERRHEDINELAVIAIKYKAMQDENEQLQERNNRQCKQLDNLYTLIEKQDWETLKGIIQEFQECEEQLQKEWGTYGDFE